MFIQTGGSVLLLQRAFSPRLSAGQLAGRHSMECLPSWSRPFATFALSRYIPTTLQARRTDTALLRDDDVTRQSIGFLRPTDFRSTLGTFKGVRYINKTID